MPAMTKTLYQCPYCPRGQGVIAIDMEELSIYTARPLAAATSSTVVPPIIRFNPRAAWGSPCRHTVAFEIFGTFLPLIQREWWERPIQFEAQWFDPWFADHDPDGLLRNTVHRAMTNPKSGGVHPQGPHRFDRVTRNWLWPDLRWQLEVVSVYTAVQEPWAFFSELTTPECLAGNT